MKDEEYKKYIRLITEDKLDEATDFRRKTMPRYIYKFYSLYSKTGRGKVDKRTLSTLKDNKIWCSKIECFNDPYEGIGFYFEDNKETEEKLANLLRIASFTEDSISNVSMWAYYANNHKGFCVKYEVTDKRYLYDVNYVEHRKSQKSIWLDAMKKTMYHKSTDKEQLLLFEKYLIKHKSWSNEKEYRIIIDTEDDDLYGKAVECKDIGIKPVRIYTGIHCEDEAKKILNAISLHLGCGQVKECELSEDEFILIKE